MNLQKRQRGFSLVEMLTVVAILGVLSLVSVPAFMNYQRSLAVKNSMRQFTSDLRAARQRAVANTSQVRVTVPATTPVEERHSYTVHESRDRGATFTQITARELDKITWFADSGNITFLPNGTVQFPAGVSSETMTIDSANKYGTKSYDVTVTISGKISAQ